MMTNEWRPRSTCQWAGGGDVGSSEGGFASGDTGGGWGGDFSGGGGGQFSSDSTGPSDSGSPFSSDGGSPYSSDSGSPFSSDGGSPYSSDGGSPYSSDGGSPYSSDGGSPYSSDGGAYTGPGDYSGMSPSAVDAAMGGSGAGPFGGFQGDSTTGGGPFGGGPQGGGPFGGFQSGPHGQVGPGFGNFFDPGTNNNPTDNLDADLNAPPVQVDPGGLGLGGRTDSRGPYTGEVDITTMQNLAPPGADITGSVQGQFNAPYTGHGPYSADPYSADPEGQQNETASKSTQENISRGTDPISAIYESQFGPNTLAGQLGYESIGKNDQQQTDPTNISPDLATQLGINEVGVNNAWQNAVNTLSQLNTDPQAQMIIAQELGRQNEADPTAGWLGNFNPGRTGAFEQEGFNPMQNYAPTTQENQGTQGLRSEAPSLMDMFNPVSTARADEADLLSSTQFNQSLNELGSQYGRNAQALDNLANQMTQYYQDSRAAAEAMQPQVSNTAAKGDFAGPYGRGGATFNYDFAQNFNPNNLQPTLDYVAPRGDITPADLSLYQGQQMTQGQPQFSGQPSLGRDNDTPGKSDLFAPSQQAQDTFDSRFGDPQQQQQAQTQMPAWMTNLTNDPNLMSTVQGFNPNTLSWAVPSQLVGLPTDMFTTQPQQARTAYDPQLDPSVNPFAPPGWYGAPTTFQAPTTTAPARTADDRSATPLSRDAFTERSGPERGISPLDRDANIARQVERAVTERAPTIEREASRAPLQVTVPGRPPATSPFGGRSSGGFNPSNVSRGQLDSLLAQARDPNLSQAGRIAALDQLNGIISAMKAAGLANPFGRDPDPNIAAALRQGR